MAHQFDPEKKTLTIDLASPVGLAYAAIAAVVGEKVEEFKGVGESVHKFVDSLPPNEQMALVGATMVLQQALTS